MIHSQTSHLQQYSSLYLRSGRWRAEKSRTGQHEYQSWCNLPDRCNTLQFLPAIDYDFEFESLRKLKFPHYGHEFGKSCLKNIFVIPVRIQTVPIPTTC